MGGSSDVSAEAALGIPALFQAVSLIADSIASLPFHVVEVDDEDNMEIRKNHFIYPLIRYEPSELYSMYTFWQTMLVHMLTQGDGLAYIIRNGAGRAVELRLLDPSNVTIEVDAGRVTYKVAGANRSFSSRNIIHVKALSWNGAQGLDMLHLHRKTISQALANDELLTKFYENGAFLSGILKHPQKLTQEQVDSLANSFKKAFGGAGQSGGTPVLTGGLEYMPVQLSPAQSGSHDSKKLSVKDIARIYGIPAFMLGDMESATLNNYELGVQLFINSTLAPITKEIMQEVNRKVFLPSERWRYQLYIDLDALTLADLKSKSEYLQTLFNIGAATTNELRKEVGMKPVDNGDTRYVPMNFVDADEPRRAEEEALRQLFGANGKNN